MECIICEILEKTDYVITAPYCNHIWMWLESPWWSASFCTTNITVTSWWAGWRLKSPAYRLFAQSFAQAQVKENIKALRHWPLEGNSPLTSEFPARRTSKMEMRPFNDVILNKRHCVETHNCVLGWQHCDNQQNGFLLNTFFYLRTRQKSTTLGLRYSNICDSRRINDSTLGRCITHFSSACIYRRKSVVHSYTKRGTTLSWRHNE